METRDNEIEWRDPEPQSCPQHRRNWAERLAELKKNPGRWAMIGRMKNTSSAWSTLYNLRYNKFVSFDVDEGFEFTYRGPEIFGRYNPENQDAD